MNATTARSIANNARIQESIKQPMELINNLICEAASQGETELTLPNHYDLRSVSNTEFSHIIDHLKKQDFNPVFKARSTPQKETPEDHPLDHHTITISWN